MGKTQSKLKFTNTQSEFINHPKFQDVQLVTSSKQKFLKVKYNLHSQNQLKNWQKSLKSIQTFNKDNLLLPYEYQFIKSGYCGSGGILTLIFDNYPYLLREQIQNRKSLNKRFQQNQLWYLLYSIITVCQAFSTKSLKVGDIRPQNIFINQDGQIKLAHIYSWPNEQINYFKTLQSRQITYISPEQLTQIQLNVTNPISINNLSQAFSIGLTMLDVGLLQSSQKIYNLKNFKINQIPFNNLIQQWKKSQYSQFLKQTVINFLSLDVMKRKNPSEIYKTLLPYQLEIQQLRPFQVNYKIQMNQQFTETPVKSLNKPYQYETQIKVSNVDTNYQKNRSANKNIQLPLNHQNQHQMSLNNSVKQKSFQRNSSTNLNSVVINYSHPNNVRFSQPRPLINDHLNIFDGKNVYKNPIAPIQQNRTNIISGQPLQNNINQQVKINKIIQGNQIRNYNNNNNTNPIQVLEFRLSQIDQQIALSRQRFPS